MSGVRIGTSGWSYPSGEGTWNGIFYPRQPSRRPRGAPKFDELAFYAEHFDTVEVNSSFYRVPAVQVVQAWVERTPPGFEFSLKLYQKFTHPEMFAKATGGDPAALGQQDADEFRRAIDPLASVGKLGAVLAQFPPRFKNEPESLAYLQWLLEAFRDFPMALELRHRTWSDAPDATLALLESYGASWAHIDEPKFNTSIRQTFAPDLPGVFYLRLHGRNAEQWWRHDKSEDRYNYMYTAAELAPFADAASRAARADRKAYVYANNHFSAKSVANAAILKHQLGQELDGQYPAEMVERYPDLRGIVRILPSGRPA